MLYTLQVYALIAFIVFGVSGAFFLTVIAVKLPRLRTGSSGNAAHCIRKTSRIVREFTNDIAKSRNEFAKCGMKSAI